MKTIPLYGEKAAGRVALVDDEDFPVISRYHWIVQEVERPGRNSGPYAVTTFNRRQAKPQYLSIMMHCLILACFTGIDHRNGNGLDNQKDNLRIATASQNAANQGARVGTSQYKGVSWERRQRKWKAQVRVNGQIQYLGYFTDEEEAARAYDTAALATWGDYARLNFEEDR
jgi:hypothetical protein